MVLVDTTVWIDFFAAKATSQVSALEFLISDGHDICVCGIILTEVLQGVRNDKQHREIKTHFDNLPYLPMTRAVFLLAADIYRSLRKRGITIRNSIDCMIASVAISSDAQLLHNDRDFNPIEKHCELTTVNISAMNNFS